MKFSLIDRIVELKAGESIRAVKNLSLAEEYLQDHFPGFPIMPGVLQVEALVQAGAWLLRFTEDFAYSATLLKEAKAVRFNNFVAPGQTLEINCSVHQRDEKTCTLKASGSVQGKSTVTARIILQQFNLKESNPELAESDERRIARLREEFAVLWRGENA